MKKQFLHEIEIETLGIEFLVYTSSDCSTSDDSVNKYKHKI